MKLIIVALFSWMLMLTATAQNSYKISKEWKVDDNTQLELVAKNQNFKVEFWDKENVRIDFVLETKTAKIDEDDFKDGLKVTAEKSGNKFTINTNLDNLASSSIWSWLFNDKKNKDNYKINNTLYLPKSVTSLGFTLNYCDLTIGEINLPMKIASNYGNVSVLKNKKRTIINNTYTDNQLGEMGYVKINSSYSDFILNTIDTLMAGSNYGNIKLTSCPYIQSLVTNYGDITIQKVGSVKVTSTYSDIKINAVSEDVNATLTYSDIKLSDIAKNIGGIWITGNYSDCSLKINPDNPVNLIVNDVNGDISIKNPQIIITKKNETDNATNMTAKTKSATDASPIIKITTSNSDLIIN